MEVISEDSEDIRNETLLTHRNEKISEYQKAGFDDPAFLA
jgi:hypothetical protein